MSAVDSFSPQLLRKIDAILKPKPATPVVDTMSPEMRAAIEADRKNAPKESVDAAQLFLNSVNGRLLDMSTSEIAQANIDAIGSSMAKNGHNFTSLSGYEYGFKIAKKKGLLKFKSDSQVAPTPAPAPVAAAPVTPKQETIVAQPIVVEAPVEEVIKPSAEFMIAAHESIQSFMFSPAAKEVVLDSAAVNSIVNILLQANLPPTAEGLQKAYEAAKSKGLLTIRVDHAAIARAAEAKRIADAKAAADAEAYAKEHRLDWLTPAWVRDASTNELKELMEKDPEAQAKMVALRNNEHTAAADKLKRDSYEKQQFQNESAIPSGRRNHANFESSEEREAKRTAALKEAETAKNAREAAIKEFEDEHHTLGENDSWGRPLPKDQVELVRSTWTKETRAAWARIDDKFRVTEAYTRNNDSNFTDVNGRVNHARAEEARRGKGPKVEAVNTDPDALNIRTATEADLRKATVAQVKSYVSRRREAGLS